MDGEKCGYIDGERGVPTKMEKGEVPEMDGEKSAWTDGERGSAGNGQRKKCPNKRKSA